VRTWRARQLGLSVCLALAALWCGQASAISIYDIQYTAAPAGDSPYNASILACDGGIVTHLFPGSRPRVILYDPAHPNEWGAIQVKDATGDATTSQFYSQVSIGDFVSLTGVYVEEYRGTTYLQYDPSAYGSSFSIDSTGNPVPAPILVSLAEISAPVEGPPGEWYVADHSAEKYESMYLMIQDVTVTAMDLGKALDNYNLAGLAGGDVIAGLADGNVWASDYMNVALPPGDLYMPEVALGAGFGSVSGVLEQYTRTSNGWDYYQLLTTRSSDFGQREAAIPEPASVVLVLLGMAGLRRARRLRARR